MKAFLYYVIYNHHEIASQLPTGHETVSRHLQRLMGIWPAIELHMLMWPYSFQKDFQVRLVSLSSSPIKPLSCYRFKFSIHPSERSVTFTVLCELYQYIVDKYRQIVHQQNKVPLIPLAD